MSIAAGLALFLATLAFMEAFAYVVHRWVPRVRITWPVVVTFVGAYIPYLGAWGAGAFTVLIALGGAGTDAAIGMAVVQLLANGILQQLVQPIAYGAALGIHPLAVLIVTIGGGALFGAVGLILGAPLTSAVTKISTDLARARVEERGPPEPDKGGGPVPEPAG